METKFTEKGFLNQHLKVQMDNSNINNGRNADVFSQILVGNVKSSLMDCLLNLGYIEYSGSAKPPLRKSENRLFCPVTKMFLMLL